MEIELRDWADWDLNITVSDADRLNTLDKLRITDPVLHTMIMGATTVTSMARTILYPETFVLWQLRKYKQDGIVEDRDGIRSVQWYFNSIPDASYVNLKDWVRGQRLKGGLFYPPQE